MFKQIALITCISLMTGCEPEPVIIPAPVANFICVESIPVGEKIYFQNLTTPLECDDFMWNFGDGSSINSEESPEHIYQTSGSKTVSLIARTQSGVDTFSRVIYVEQ